MLKFPDIYGPDDTEDNRPPLVIRPASLRDSAAIPPREWLYGTMLLSRYISVLVSPGGVGKTALTSGIALAVAYGPVNAADSRGNGVLGDWVHRRANVLVCNLEDPEDEFDRRVAAFQAVHRIPTDRLSGRIYTLNGRERHLRIASLDADRLSVCYPDKDELIELIRDSRIGLVVVDPFVNSHDLDENSNPHINAAARAWAEIANETGCAILLVHHTRKGALAGDIDSARGASALVSAARVGLTLSPMSEDEAAKMGIKPEERRLHIRLDDAKANLSPPSDKARWFKLNSVALGNKSDDYPNGDRVQAVTSWEPPSVWAEHTAERLNEVLDVIAAGQPSGGLYLAAKGGRGGTSPRWVGNVLISMLEVEEAQASVMVSAWFKSGLLIREQFKNENRKMVDGVVVDNSKRPQ